MDSRTFIGGQRLIRTRRVNYLELLVQNFGHGELSAELFPISDTRGLRILPTLSLQCFEYLEHLHRYCRGWCRLVAR